MINITGGAIKKNTKEKTSVKTEYENIEVERESTRVKMLACLNRNHGMVSQVLHKCPVSCANLCLWENDRS